MFIRPFTREDVYEAVTIIFSAFASDDGYALIFPRKHLYPDDLRRFSLLRLRYRLVQPGCHAIVIVTEPSDPEWTGKQEIVGYAMFSRKGNDEAAKKWQVDSLFNKCERGLLSMEMLYNVKVLDRAMDTHLAHTYENALPHKTYARLDPRWHCALVVVSDKHQRRGIGRKLMEHGMAWATEENLPMTLEASIPGRGLYTKMGFKIVHEITVLEAGGFTGLAMVWEPEGVKGKFLKHTKEKWADVIV